MQAKRPALVLGVLFALSTAVVTFETVSAAPPRCPAGLERHGNRCEAPGSGQVTGANPRK